jgi:carbonic anhydrase
VIACSDSRVIPEAIFDAGIGELFIIRVAGNVLDRHQLGSIEYAAAHLHCPLILVLGHTGCGAVGAALSGGGEGYIQYITDEILLAVGEERDPDRACRLNVKHAVDTIKRAFADHPEIPSAGLDIRGAVYDIASGEVEWI